jgi:ribonuclease HI
MTIRAAADGSALGNPGPAGWAWYVDDDCWAAGGWKHATNNQGELMAVLQFFRATAHLPDDLLILCDSQYVINCITKWMPGWKKKGWRKADGKPVMNVELLKEIDDALVGRTYRFEWVKGHANHPLNEAADTRARAASEAFQRGRPVDAGPGWSRQGEPDAAAPVVAWTPVTQTPVALPAAVPEPSLFSFDDDIAEQAVGTPAAPQAFVEVTARLSPEQHERLLALASRRGVSVEQALAALV